MFVEKLGIKTYFANSYHLIILFILFTIYLVLLDFSLFTPYTKIPDRFNTDNINGLKELFVY